MATASSKYLPIPDISVPVIDPKTGKMTEDWYRFFKQLFNTSRVVRSEIP